MSKQKTIGVNPLEQYLSRNNSKDTEPVAQAPLASNQNQDLEITAQVEQPAIAPAIAAPLTTLSNVSSETPTKQRITIHLSTELIDRVKNAVFWEPGLTLAAFAEYALYQAVEKLEQERGTPYPQRREQNLRGGRPLK